MALEAESLRPGGETVITRLSDVLVVQALRAWLESDVYRPPAPPARRASGSSTWGLRCEATVRSGPAGGAA
jgi:hypothetical protein